MAWTSLVPGKVAARAGAMDDGRSRKLDVTFRSENQPKAGPEAWPLNRIKPTSPNHMSPPPQGADLHGPPVDDIEKIAALRQVLRATGYPGSNVREVLGQQIGPAHLRMDLPLYLKRLAAPNPLNTLVKLFALGVPVNETDAQPALAPLGVEGAVALGLLARDGRRVRPLVGISACDGLLLAHDRLHDDGGEPRPDHVLGVNPAAITIGNLTVRRPVRSALDVGTGCGIQALLVARHSEHVVAIDINPRALSFVRFNIRLNEVTNVECLQGSLFGPVAGRQFDLIVCNPPYVISPETKYLFRDSGLPGDTICEGLIRQIHAYLNDGGFACVLCNWALRKEEEWSLPLRRWVEGNGCDAWFLRNATQDPLTYAAIWTRDRNANAYQDGLERWAQYYDDNAIHAIGLGAVILRRRASGTNWLRPDELPTAPAESCSDLILGVFQTEDYLAALGNGGAIFNQRFRLVGDHQVRQTLVNRQGQYVVAQIELHWQRGYRFHGAIDACTCQLLSRCNGALTLGEIIAELEKIPESPPLNIAAAAENIVRRFNIAAAAENIVRRLLALGVLTPAP